MVATSVSTPPRQVRKCESPQSVKLRKKPQRRPLCDFQARWEKLEQHWKQSCGSHMTDNGEVFDWLEYKPDTQAVGCKLCAKYIAEGPCKPSHRKNTWACYTAMPTIGNESCAAQKPVSYIQQPSHILGTAVHWNLTGFIQGQQHGIASAARTMSLLRHSGITCHHHLNM